MERDKAPATRTRDVIRQRNWNPCHPLVTPIADREGSRVPLAGRFGRYGARRRDVFERPVSAETEEALGNA